MTNILIFTGLTIINVVLSTVRSICTIKCGKWIGAVTNAVCYGFYPLIVMLTAKDMVTIVANMIITAVVNFVCVWVIKLVEEKTRKERMWKVELALPNRHNAETFKELFEESGIPCNYIIVGKWIMFNCYCMTQKQTALVVETARVNKGKYSAYESKI